MIDLDDILETVEEVEKEPPTEELVEMAILQLDSVCDGAITDDGVGFAGMHARTGKKIAARLKTGLKLTMLQARWARHALSYYLNTQLDWIDKEDFKIAADDAYEKARTRESARINKNLALSRSLETLSREEMVKLFKSIDMQIVEAKDQAFIRGLKQWPKDYSPKQYIFVRKFITKYAQKGLNQ